MASARRLLRASARRSEGLFLAEGRQAVGAGLAAGALIEVYVGEASLARHADLLEGAAVPVRVVSEAAVASLSETVTPQGIVGVAPVPAASLADLARLAGRRPGLAGLDGAGLDAVGLDAVGLDGAGLDGAGLLVAVLVEVRDPGNAGTVIRAADAAGADVVVFAGDCVDPRGGKSVRSSAGSVFHLPVVTGVSAAEAIDAARAAGCRVLAAAGDGASDLDDEADAGRLSAPTAWLFGNEAHGLPLVVRQAADATIRVPVYGQAESLNLAAAAVVCLYATARAQKVGRSGVREPGEVGRGDARGHVSR